MRTRDYIEKGDSEGKSLIDAMEQGEQDGMQTFDGVLEKMVRDGVLTQEGALPYSTNANNLTPPPGRSQRTSCYPKGHRRLEGSRLHD